MRWKYGNKKVTYDGIKFDSKKEGQRYLQLKLMEKEGKIGYLVCHPTYQLLPTFRHGGKTYRGVKYIPDFRYFTDDGKQVFEDVKGVRTKDYILKMKWFVSSLREHDEFKEV
jgi:hypothetical protein